jgi:hypothetical protein
MKRTGIEHSTVFINPVVLVTVICENDDSRKRVQPQRVVEIPIHRLDGEREGAQVTLLQQRHDKLAQRWLRIRGRHDTVSSDSRERVSTVNDDLLRVKPDSARAQSIQQAQVREQQRNNRLHRNNPPTGVAGEQTIW